MYRSIIFMVIIEVTVTLCFAKIALWSLGTERRLAAATLSGVAFPLMAITIAVIFFAFQPVEKDAWSGLAFTTVLTLALYALPVCLGTSLLAIYLSKR